MSIEQWRGSTEVALQDQQDVAIHRLGEWAHSADAAYGIATKLVETSFCPESFRNKPGEATAAILAGLEVGLQPMAALRSFDVIQGQAAPRAVTLRAIVQAHGHELEMIESSATRCRMRGRRKGATSWQEVVWTIDRAKQLGVTGKTNWKNQPQAMLVARATSELARLVASDAILGIGYTVEEIADGGQLDEPDATVSPIPTGTRKMSRRKATEEQPPPEEPASESPLLDMEGKLAKRMFATFNELGITERDARLRYTSDVLGREITTGHEMTDADAEAVVAALEADRDQPFPTGDAK